jgi:hypothetical protein
MSDVKNTIREELKKNNGVLRFAPAWVGRTILKPGRRLKLDVRDIYARGAQWGGISERWMASTGMVDNGSTTYENEGMSFVVVDTPAGPEKVMFKNAIDEVGDEILGKNIMNKWGGLKSFAKFYDFQTPIPHHVHLREEHAKAVGDTPKPESYFFPSELNQFDYMGGHTYFGLAPQTTREQLKTYIEDWGKGGDNGILELATAYRLKLNTGWDVPAGILHAPGSLVTYEPQWVSDCSLFWQSMIRDNFFERDLLVKFIPEEKKWDLDYLIDCLDWEANIDPDFKKNHYHEPIPVEELGAMNEKGYSEEWISYGSDKFSAKRLVVAPGREVTITDGAAYGFIAMQGVGQIQGINIETPAVIRYEQLTRDEFYVSESAAQQGVVIKNTSDVSELVLLKHFGPDNPDAQKFVK